MTTDFSRIEFQIAGPVAKVMLNRPDKRNALDDQTISDLRVALAQAGQDSTVRVITLSGAGKDFCAGADLSALEKIAKARALENLSDAEGFMNLFVQMRHTPQPVVALVSGRALAGGCGLASACDVILAAESAQFGYPEVKIGFIPAMVMAILRRNISEKRAFDWMARAEPISAAEAERYGLINFVFPDAEFTQRAEEYVQTLATRSASAMYLMKRLLYHMDGLGFEAAIRSGADVNVLCRMTEDCQAGVARFLKKS